MQWEQVSINLQNEKRTSLVKPPIQTVTNLDPFFTSRQYCHLADYNAPIRKKIINATLIQSQIFGSFLVFLKGLRVDISEVKFNRAFVDTLEVLEQ